MRVIVTNQGQNQGSVPQPMPAPLFDTGKFHIRDGDVVYVSGLPEAQGDLVGFRLTDGTFARGTDLKYGDWLMHNRAEVSEWLEAQPMEKAPADDYKRQAAAVQGVGTARSINGLTGRI